MGITSTIITQKILEALRDSAAILAKSQALFSVPHSVFAGFSGEEPPPAERMPYFQLFPALKTAGEEEDNLSFMVNLGVSLHDPTKTEATTEDGVYTAIFQGAQSLEELVDLAVAEIRNLSPQLFIDHENTLYDPLEYFPLFGGVITLTFNVPKTAGVFTQPDL